MGYLASPIGLILLSVLFSLMLAEGVVRVVMGSPWPEQLPLLEVMPDPQVGYRMAPGTFHYTYNIPVQLNSLGFRGGELSLEKPAHEIRVLALGDSHVYGQGVADGALMTTVLEGLLNQTASPCRVRVVNLGVRAYSLNQEAALLGMMGEKLQGDYLLVFPYINDFESVNVALRYGRYRQFDRYLFDLSAPGEVGVLWQWRGVQLLRHSGLLMWGYDVVQRIRNRDILENRLLLGRMDDRARQAQGETESTLQKLTILANKLRLPTTVIPIPVAVQLKMAFPQEHYQSFFQKAAAKIGFGYFDPLPAMKHVYQQSGHWPVIPYDGHYDGQGQTWLAQGVAEYFRERPLACGPRAQRD